MNSEPTDAERLYADAKVILSTCPDCGYVGDGCVCYEYSDAWLDDLRQWDVDSRLDELYGDEQPSSTAKPCSITRGQAMSDERKPNSSYKQARGIIPWQDGDEPAEVSIRRYRDGSPNTDDILTYCQHLEARVEQLEAQIAALTGDHK